MTKIKYSALISSMKGNLNGSTFQGSPSGQILRNNPTQVTLRNNTRQATKNQFAQITAAWRQLSDAQRSTWLNHTENGKSGFYLYSSRNRHVLAAGGTIVKTFAISPAFPTELITENRVFISNSSGKPVIRIHVRDYTNPQGYTFGLLVNIAMTRSIGAKASLLKEARRYFPLINPFQNSFSFAGVVTDFYPGYVRSADIPAKGQIAMMLRLFDLNTGQLLIKSNFGSRVWPDEFPPQ